MVDGAFRWKLGIVVALAWVIGSSLVAGATLTAQSVSSLSKFGAAGVTGSIVVVSLTRQLAPGIAVHALWQGAVHGTSATNPKVPLATFLAVFPMVGLAVATAAAPALVITTLGFDVEREQFWSNVNEYVFANDFYVGATRSAGYALSMAALSPWLLRRIHSAVRSKKGRLFAAWLSGSVVVSVVEGLFGWAFNLV